MRKPVPLSAVVLALTASTHCFAQTSPDAGRILQELAIPPQPIAPSADVRIQSPLPPEDTAQGGPQIELRQIRFKGITRFDEEALSAVVHEALGQPHDLAGLRNLARRITRFYREHGYPFARAYLPPQRMTEGALLIEVIEGKYGAIAAVGEPDLAAQAQPYLSALRPGAVIEGTQLERAALILGDLPGIVLVPVVKPGREVGTGDVEARIARGQAFDGTLRVDNHGNRYSGRYRALAAFNWNSPFMLGDRVSASALVSDENLRFGQLSYSRPLGSSGLRGMVGYAHTHYELGEEFASLDAAGIAKIASAGVSYPIVRTRNRNLLLSVQYQHKKLRDEYGSVDVVNNKSSDSLPVSFRFDLRDDLAGGGISYGVLSWIAGDLSLDSRDLREQDRLGANTEGGFQKLVLDVARVQRLSGDFSLYGRFTGQLADKNLDSSESFSLGGANGVRAYPQGEGTGDTGWLTQLELRYAAGEFTPYVFYDIGRIARKVSPWATGDNRRSISGFGVGARWVHKGFSVDVLAGWRAGGGKPESDARTSQPRVLLTAEYKL